MQPYSMINLNTLKLWSELNNFGKIDELGLQILSEDLAYRTREVVNIAVNHMIHCRRRKLKVSDVDRAFELYGVEKAFGYSNKEPFKYKTEDLENNKCVYHITDDLEELNLSETNEYSLDLVPNVDAKWTIINGKRVKEDDDTIQDEFIPQLDSDLKKYYEVIVKVILNELPISQEENENLFNRILLDLKTNTKIQSMLPYLVRFINQIVLHLAQLNINMNFIEYMTNIDYLKRLITVLNKIIQNKSLFIAPKGYFSKVLSCLLYLTLHSILITDKYSYDLVVREKSSLVMIEFLNLYETYSLNSIDYIKKSYFVNNLKRTNEYSINNLSTIYGILCCLFYLGPKHIEDLYSYLIDFFKYLSANESELDVKKASCEALCLNLLVSYYKWKKDSSNYETLIKLYNDIYNLYADRFINMIIEPLSFKNEYQRQVKKLKGTSLVKQIKKNSIVYKLDDVFEGFKLVNRPIIKIQL